MNRSLIYFLESRDNNFNLIRFIAAFGVLFSHSFSLALGRTDTEPFKQFFGMSFGQIAVDIFFISSGFLIANSLFIKKDLANFFWARFLRIYPGLFVAVLFSVFFVGLYFTSYPVEQYLMNPQTYIFLAKNTVLFLGEEPGLPGVFESLPWPGVVNGSLWTLPFEVRAYCLLVVFSIVIHRLITWSKGLLSERLLYSLIPLMGMIIYIANHFYTFLPISYFSSEDFRMYSLFFIGTACYIFKDYLVLSKRFFYTALFFLFISAIHSDLFFIVYNVTIFYVIFYIAYIPKGRIRKFNQYGDYSYGIYIYAWPVQQSIIALMPGINVLELCIYSFALTVLLSYLSWHCIEKKALKLKGKVLFKFKV
ncbi:acyltransferase [Colwellia sp. Arc7-635]|uniref:acyltransferase family protein n=1 Tax=Colwellia sp. Arc7-635 TaxID=2497879 RepID=UPI000F858B4F|nr:acyltransferase [Colwellia sp. Arc7-635]AZQ82864.1 acyltransferase [Colwellia sp. Arc7-635]